jgi:N utilization substance protein B
MSDAPPFASSLVREVALQMLYQWEMSGDDLDVVFELYPRVTPLAVTEVQMAAAMQLARAVATDLPEIDALIEAHAANWRLSRMQAIDRLVLRLATCELRAMRGASGIGAFMNDVLDLARRYSGEAAVRFANGVLDAIHKDLAARQVG